MKKNFCLDIDEFGNLQTIWLRYGNSDSDVFAAIPTNMNNWRSDLESQLNFLQHRADEIYIQCIPFVPAIKERNKYKPVFLHVDLLNAALEKFAVDEIKSYDAGDNNI